MEPGGVVAGHRPSRSSHRRGKDSFAPANTDHVFETMSALGVPTSLGMTAPPPLDPSDRPSQAWPALPVPPRVAAVTGVAAVLLLWGLTGWSVLALGMALGAALALRIVGVALLPRRLLDRAAVLSLPVAVLALIVQSTWWAVALAAGLSFACLALTQRARTRAVAAGLGLALVAAGGAGLGVGLVAATASQEADRVAADEFSRGQILPHRPDQVPPDLMRRIVDATTRNEASCSNFDEHGQREFLAAFGSSDCRSALQAAGAQIVKPNDYDRIDASSLRVQPRPDGTVLVDTCAVRWRDEALSWVLSRPAGPRPGPPPGRLVVAPAFTVAWRITAYQRC